VPLSIKDPEADRLARAVARQMGTSITHAVIAALREQLLRTERHAMTEQMLIEEAMAIGKHCASLPLRDTRTPEAMLYDEHGLPQ
jgi:antitoxin VapB